MISSKLVFMLMLFAGLCSPLSAATTIKFAILAPRGSTWMNGIEAFAQEVSDKTKGEVNFKFYPGGIQGDEKDVIKKIRLGQLHSGGFTGVGIGEIAPQLRLLDAPFLFRNEKEVDYIHKLYDADFRKYLKDGGYVLLGWTEVGFVYLFTQVPVNKVEDLKGVKMWMWDGDAIAEAALRALSISAVPLSVTDVMSSLQTGMINGFYGSPLSVIAMQWFTRAKYMFSIALADSAGAVIIADKVFSKLTPEQQQILLSCGEKHFKEVTRLSRLDNAKAIETLKKEGIRVTEPQSPDERDRIEQLGPQARRSLAGKLYPAELLNKVEKSLTDFRKPKK